MSTSLSHVTEHDLVRLSQILWSWEYCDDCKQGSGCVGQSCPAYRKRPRLRRYFTYYKQTCWCWDPQSQSDAGHFLCSQNGLLDCLQFLRSNPQLSRNKLIEHFQVGRTAATKAEIELALDLATTVMFMLGRHIPSHNDLDLVERGLFQQPWRGSQKLSDFINGNFFSNSTTGWSPQEGDGKYSKKRWKATKLVKHAGLTLKATDDLRRHLRLDRAAGILEIFHHTAFLKEHLRLTMDLGSDADVEQCLTRGALPRQLVCETLDSIQKLLFPLGEEKSKNLLQSLVASEGFDPDCVDFVSAALRNSDERGITYYYWGPRLADLQRESDNPTPRSWVEVWLERKSGARHVMLATLIGVIFAVVLGIASLAVSGYQAWVGYQAWKHPVT